MLTLRALASLAEVSTSRVRYYVSIGLLPHSRSGRGEYLFDDSCGRRIQLINQLQGHHLTLVEISALLDQHDGEDVRRATRECVAQRRDRLAALERLLDEAGEMRDEG